jgi:hypothetical protein
MRKIIPEPCSMLDAWLWFYRWVGGGAADIKMQCGILFRRKVSQSWQGPQSFSAANP